MQPGIEYSTIIAVRESDPYLGEAISSVLNQTLTPTQVLVVVGTTDLGCQSITTAESFGSPVKAIPLAQEGLVPALNLGLSHVRTEYVSFLDSDDVWLESKQETQLRMLSADPRLDAVNGLVTNFRDNPRGEREFLTTAEASVLGAVTFRSDAFSRFGGFDPDSTHFTHLYRWTLRAKGMGLKSRSTGEVGVYRRIHSQNGWVVHKEQGLAELHSELRRALRDRAKSSGHGDHLR
jgi:glycosyltransferase involved in cell wall biosynthesis